MENGFFQIDSRLQSLSEQALQKAAPAFRVIDATTEYNQQKVLSAFIEKQVSESHFTATTGYGYGDRGRDKLDEVFARAMGTEDALVRHSILSGTQIRRADQPDEEISLTLPEEETVPEEELDTTLPGETAENAA